MGYVIHMVHKPLPRWMHVQVLSDTTKAFFINDSLVVNVALLELDCWKPWGFQTKVLDTAPQKHGQSLARAISNFKFRNMRITTSSWSLASCIGQWCPLGKNISEWQNGYHWIGLREQKIQETSIFDHPFIQERLLFRSCCGKDNRLVYTRASVLFWLMSIIILKDQKKTEKNHWNPLVIAPIISSQDELINPFKNCASQCLSVWW